MDGSRPNASILCADTDAALRRWLEERAGEAGWRVEAAAPGEDMVRALSSGRYDVVISDLLLPGLDGSFLLRRAQEANPDQAVIIVSSHGSPEAAVELLRNGAVDYLRKPFDYRVLENAVRRVLSETFREQFERGIYRFAEEERSSFVFTSRDIEGEKVPLLIVDRLYRAGRIDTRMRVKLSIAFQEAVANAHEHGNLELDSSWREEVSEAGVDTYSLVKRRRLDDPHYSDRKVGVITCYRAGILEITVSDEGHGFIPEASSSSEKNQEIPLSHGRGLTIIKGTMDEVTHSRRGTVIRMVKCLGG